MPADSLLFTALAFALTTLVFIPLNLLRRRRTTSEPHVDDQNQITVRGLRRFLFAINAASAVTFLSFYLSLSLIPAATTSALETAFAPAALIALFPYVMHRHPSYRARQFGLTALLACLGCVLAWHTWRFDSPNVDTIDSLLGFGLGALAGAGMAAVTLLSREFGEQGVSPITVTAHRFHLTYLLAVVFWLSSRPPVPSGEKLLSYILLGVVAVVVPLYLLQVGLQRVDPHVGIAIVVTLPGVTYLVQVAHGQSAEPLTFALLGAIILTAFAQSRRPRIETKNRARPNH